MPKTMDQTFAYVGYHGCDSLCRLRVWQQEGQVPVVLFSELDTVNVGTSITNRIEHLAYEAFKLLERPEGGIQVIEHYPDRGFVNGKPRYKEDFDLVTFTQTKQGYTYPVWRRISKEEVERRIGEILTD